MIFILGQPKAVSLFNVEETDMKSAKVVIYVSIF